MYHSFNMIFLFLLVGKQSTVGPQLTCSISALETQGAFLLLPVLGRPRFRSHQITTGWVHVYLCVMHEYLEAGKRPSCSCEELIRTFLLGYLSSSSLTRPQSGSNFDRYYALGSHCVQSFSYQKTRDSLRKQLIGFFFVASMVFNFYYDIYIYHNKVYI